jgi:hypothetical protein
MTVDLAALRKQGSIFYVFRRTTAAFAVVVFVVGIRLVLWWLIDKRFAYGSVDIYLLVILLGSIAVMTLNIVAVWRALHPER